jgi:hypothetical protein
MIKNILTAVLLLLCCTNNALAYDVKFNTKTYKYHNPKCEWAIKCTKNCIKIDSTEAKQKGGVPCKVCGGVEKFFN